MRRIAIIGMLSILLSADLARAEPSNTLMVGSQFVLGRVYLLGEDAVQAGDFLFVAQIAGRVVTSSGVHDGPWFEGLLVLPTTIRSFRGSLTQPTSFSASSGGSMRMPLGDLGEARLDISEVVPEAVPLDCPGFSVGSTTGLDDWTTSTFFLHPYTANVSGAVAGYTASGVRPDRSSRPFVFTAEDGTARVRDMRGFPFPTPVGIGAGIGCIN